MTNDDFWRPIRRDAPVHIKSFIAPARGTLDGKQAILFFGPTHRFHYNNLRKHHDELATLIAHAHGIGYELVIAFDDLSDV